MSRIPAPWLLALAPVAALGACLGTIRPLPEDWERPLPPAAAKVAAPVLADAGMDADGSVVMVEVPPPPEPTDPLLVEEALRGRVKTASLCFNDPGLCGIKADPFSLRAVRPAEGALDDLEARWAAHAAAWPVVSRLFHCETLCGWRPASGARCVAELAAHGGLEDGALRLKLLDLLDVLGTHGNGLATAWLGNANVDVRRDVAVWLSTRAVEDALAKPLLAALDQEKDEVTAISLVRAFRTLLTPEAVPLLTTLAKGSPQPRVRVAAIETLVDLQGPALRPTLSMPEVLAPAVRRGAFARAELELLGPADPLVREARAAALNRIDVLESGQDDNFDFGGGLELLTASGAPVGGVAFLDEFKSRRGGPMMNTDGPMLTNVELDSLVKRLTDAGGYGLMPLRPALAVSCQWPELSRLVELRRAIHVAKLPEQDVLAFEVTRVMRVVRTHYALRRATQWWRPAVVAEGEPLNEIP